MLLAGDVGGTKTLLGLFKTAPDRPANDVPRGSIELAFGRLGRFERGVVAAAAPFGPAAQAYERHIGRAVLGVVVAEFFGSQEGLGVMMVRAASSYHVDIVFAGVVVFAALSLAMTSLVKMIEKRLSGWRPQHANEGGGR